MRFDSPRSREVARDVANHLFHELKLAREARRGMGLSTKGYGVAFLLFTGFSPHAPLETQVLSLRQREDILELGDLWKRMEESHSGPYCRCGALQSEVMKRLRGGASFDEAREFIATYPEPRVLPLVVDRKTLLSELSACVSYGENQFDFSHENLPQGIVIKCDMHYRVDKLDDYCVCGFTEPLGGVSLFYPKSGGPCRYLSLLRLADGLLFGSGEFEVFNPVLEDGIEAPILAAIEASKRLQDYQPTPVAFMSMRERRSFFSGMVQLIFVAAEDALYVFRATTRVRFDLLQLCTGNLTKIEPTPAAVREAIDRFRMGSRVWRAGDRRTDRPNRPIHPRYKR